MSRIYDGSGGEIRFNGQNVVRFEMREAMTEHDWLICCEPARMVRWLLDQHNWRDPPVWPNKREQDRKLNLWKYACLMWQCRPHWNDMKGYRHSVTQQVDAALAGKDIPAYVDGFHHPAMLWEPEHFIRIRREGADAADLLRHIVGNPFRPTPKSDWPTDVVRLAESVVAGSEAFALHDALLEAGHPELADHFATSNAWTGRKVCERCDDARFVADEQNNWKCPACGTTFVRKERDGEFHPRGCWVLELLTGR